MTADDMREVPIGLLRRLWDLAVDTEHEDADAITELSAILNPPPEFDPGAIEALTAAIFGVGSWWSGHERAEKVLTAARDAGWEMVETSELEALRELVAAAWDDVGDAFIAQEMTQSQADAIRKAKAAQR